VHAPPRLIVIAHGVDLAPVDRIDAMLRRHQDRFVERVFTPAEAAYARRATRRQSERFAARFAAKEAAFKALGVGWSRGVSWTDVAVEHTPAGEPNLIVTGRAERLASERGIRRWLVSLSHAGGMALASVMALGDP
jgi:holo-[acyl-carrier protein] synthase